MVQLDTPAALAAIEGARAGLHETGAALSALAEAAPTSTGAADALEKFRGFDAELSDFLEQFEAKVRRLEADYFGA